MYAAGTVLIADLLQFLLDAISDAERVDAGLVSGLAYRWWDDSSASALDIARAVVPLALVAIALLRALGHFMGQYSMHWIARSLVHRLRGELFGAILALPAVVLDSQGQGAWVGRLTYNVEQMSAAVTDALKTILRESLVFVGLLGYMAYLNWRLCLVFVAITPVMVWVVRNVSRRFKRYSLGMQDAMGEVTQRANEGVAGYTDVRLHNAQAEQWGAFARASARNRQQSLKMMRVETLAGAFLQVWVALAFALLVWLALQPQWLSSLSAGVLVAFLTAASQLGKPVRQLAAVLGVLQRGVVAAQDVFEQLDRPAEADTGTLQAASTAGDLSIQDVCFAYPGSGTNALRDVSFTVGAGETVALVGRSGSGKTTLLRLLTRFYTPDTGAITLDGHDLSDYALEDFRRHVALVPQHPLLFRDTVYNNVALGAVRRVTAAEVDAALQRARAKDFVEQLPLGVNTLLGDAGAGLSGGQQQRLAIARAFLKDARLCFFDEATSALDPDTASQVRDALAWYMRGRTSIVIAHRMRTVEQADRVVVLHEGRVVAQGTHGELLSRPGLYAQLCEQELTG